MDNKERLFIKYRPDIKYVPKILSIVNPDEIYEPSPIVNRLLDTIPSGIIGSLLDLKDDLDVLSQRLDKCLEGYNQGGMSFKDYASNLKDSNGDKELVMQFELKNGTSEDGSIQAEVYPLILDATQECDNLVALLNDQIYGGTADTNRLQKHEAEDKAFIDTIIAKEMNGELLEKDYNLLETRGALLEISSRSVKNSKNFIKDVNELLYTTINTYYNNSVVDIVSKFGEADSNVLEAIKDANRISFKKSVINVNNDLTRHRRLNKSGMKDGACRMFVNISKLRDFGSNDITKWVESIDTEYDSNPYTQIVADALDDVEFIHQEYTNAMGECFKQLKLDELVKSDLASTLLQKKYARQKLKLISDIITEKSNGPFDGETFCTKYKLTTPGTLCSK